MPHWERLAVRALGASETRLTVVARRDVSPTYARITVRDEGFLARHTPFPTLWLRLWFTHEGRDHQRAFTVIDPRPEEGLFDLEFALHHGAASDWARTCAPGDSIRASLLGSTPPWQPKKHPRRGTPEAPSAALDADFAGRTVIVGDPASLPAVNSMLTRLSSRDVEVWFEYRNPDDESLPLAAAEHHRVRRIRRRGEGDELADAVLSHWDAESPGAGDRFWIAVEAQQNRKLSTTLRTRYGVPRTNIDATAYWRST
ncbi:siderophore-interacting protein [Kocuria tytonicola]|uniref:Siderophore-interacting protein n=1 Tax=Kocuria tytonicola TaxID=2055946 RepID=A0A3L9LF42_9MICC|nr:siderophore-interacting protein [Kocuria tytonicola]RLY94812.1 siderophore-interacting protein [Kocuria tytonicola]